MKNWYIAITEENHSELLEWWNGKSIDCRPPSVDEYLMSKNPKDNSCYWSKTDTDHHGLNWQQQYELITLEQFRQITNSKPMSKPEVKTIQISRTLLNNYYDASTLPQKDYLTKHFKLDGTTTDEAIRGLCELACDTWKPKIKANHPECFPEESKYFDFSKYDSHQIMKPGASEALGFGENSEPIQIRVALPVNESNYQYKGFWLNDKYDWKLVRDNHNELVLVPTKK